MPAMGKGPEIDKSALIIVDMQNDFLHRDGNGIVKLAESGLGRSRVGRVNGRDEDASRPDLRRPSLPC